jgi:hypothetical protein
MKKTKENFFLPSHPAKKDETKQKTKKVISIDPRNGNPGVNPIKDYKTRLVIDSFTDLYLHLKMDKVRSAGQL